MSFLIGSAIIAGTGALIAGGSAIHGNNQAKKAEKKVQKIAGQQQIAAANTAERLQKEGRAEKSAMVDRLLQMYDTGGLTQEQQQLAQQNIQATQASGLRDVSSLGGGLRGVGQMQGQSANEMQNLAATDANLAQQNRMSIGGMLAQAENEQEAYNKLLPYEQMVNQYQAMLGASQQNQMLGINMQAQRGQANAQAGMDIGGSLMGIGMGGLPIGGAAGGGFGGGGSSAMAQGGAGSMGGAGLYQGNQNNSLIDKSQFSNIYGK